MSGVITQRATKCDVVNRPKKLDACGFDEEGQYWPKELDFICNYKMDAL